MRQRFLWRFGAAFALLCVALLGGVPDASARRGGQGQTFRFPSEINATQLRQLMQGETLPTTIIIEKGRYLFDPQIFVFNRANVTVCGATGNPRDVIIESPGNGAGSEARAAIVLRQSRDVTFRDLTVVATAAGGEGIHLTAELNANFSGFVNNTSVIGCVLEAPNGIVATSGVDELTVDKTRFVVTGEDGFGVVWSDGEDLVVSRSRFTTNGAQAFAGVLVQGAAAELSDGQRAFRIQIARNKVNGDFLRGFDLADVVDARLIRNRVSLDGGPVRPGTQLTAGVATGRVGLLVRRADASFQPQDIELRKNKVRGAYYGAWIVNAREGVIDRNDFRRCGSGTSDEFFGGNGGGLRINLQGQCRLRVERNDLRNLRSPGTEPAVVVLPPEQAGDCFEAGNQGNKHAAGRELYEGADQ